MLKIPSGVKGRGKFQFSSLFAIKPEKCRSLFLNSISARRLKYKAASFWLKSAHLGDIFYVYSHFLFVQALGNELLVSLV